MAVNRQHLKSSAYAKRRGVNWFFVAVVTFFAGYLVTDVLDKMIRTKNNQLKPARKLFIYSGHDVTLVNVMRALNISSQTSNKPDFASALHFELHHNPIDDDPEVKVIQRKSVAHKHPTS